MLQVSIEDRIAQAIQSIIRLFISGQPAVVAFSGGKDSSLPS
jgi:tRNA(Ile)-lysidine synthase TilS/MesJ